MNEVSKEVHNELKNKILEKKPIIAFCYDFDKTLSPDDMQSFTLIPSLGMDKHSFWGESNNLAKENLMDNNLAWMNQLLVKSKALRKQVSRDYFREIGKDVPLFKGVNTWFNRVNKYGEKMGLEVQHYIISSGLKEIIEGSSVAPFIKRIYASSYLYSPDGVAEWPAQAVNYTNKTQFVFRIAKGIFEEHDERVNDSTPKYELYIPYENIVYIGDSATDIPCMRLVKSKGGFSIGVYDPVKDQRKNVYQLFNDGRINFYAPADYRRDSALFKYVRNIIDSVAANERMKFERSLLELDASMYNIFTTFQALTDDISNMPKKEKLKFDEGINLIKASIAGNID